MIVKHNPIAQAMANFIYALLGMTDRKLIIFGRENFPEEDIETAYIIIDVDQAFQRFAQSEDYDGTSETLNTVTAWRGSVFVDFQGADAHTTAFNFVNKLRTQTALELRRTYSIEIHQPRSMTDVRALQGSQYGPRVELDLVVEYNSYITESVKRIDTEQIAIFNEEGQQWPV